MLAARIKAPGQTEVVTLQTPTCGSDDVLIRVHAAGICGTDIHILKGEYEAHYPLVPGHEFSGIIEAVGDNVSRFGIGDRVTADPNIPCNRCPACQRNAPNQCENLAAIGVTRDGAFAEYVTAPESNVFHIGAMPFGAAALIEPLACVVWGLKRVQVQSGDSALVFGAGPMGCLVAQGLKQAGAAQVIVTDVVQQRLSLAKELGATDVVIADKHQAETLRAFGTFDIVADATGLPQVVQSMFSYVRPRGKIWIFGVVPPDQQASFSPYQVFRKDLTIIGSFAVNRTFQESIALIQSGAIQVEPLISHRLPLEQFSEGLRMAEHAPDRMKVQFEITRE